MSVEQLRIVPGRDPSDIFSRAQEMNPSKAFVLFSGGKDSSVTLDYMARHHREKITGALHINTGIGIPSTREFAKRFCADREIQFYEARAPLTYEDIVLKHGFPGPSAHRFMYVWLKERPLDAFVAFQKENRLDRIALITGVRAEESVRRMGTTVDLERDGASIWTAPLIDWSNADMRRYREKWDVPMSPASREVHLSGECLCGAFGSPQELELIAAMYEDVGKRIFALQHRAQAAGLHRCKWGIKYDDKPAVSGGRMCVGCDLRFDLQEGAAA